MNWNPWLWRQKAFFCAGDSMSKSQAGFGSHWEVTCQQKAFQLQGPVPGAAPLGGGRGALPSNLTALGSLEPRGTKGLGQI